MHQQTSHVQFLTFISQLNYLWSQELAGYTGGDVAFLKEDFEIQLNKTLFWDSVRRFERNFPVLTFWYSFNMT